VLARDWQNDYADLAVNLKGKLQSIESAEQRVEAIARMRRVLDAMADHKQRKRRRVSA
jgi:metallo-beta-lactamase family protein